MKKISKVEGRYIGNKLVIQRNDLNVLIAYRNYWQKKTFQQLIEL